MSCTIFIRRTKEASTQAARAGVVVQNMDTRDTRHLFSILGKKCFDIIN